MAVASVTSPALDGAETATTISQPVTSGSFATEAEAAETPRQSLAHVRRESNISEIDPNAFRVTILLASSGYRTQISVNRSFLEKASVNEGEGFLVSQLKNAIWKDWPSDWPDPLPPSPNFLRLIYGGKMLPDKNTLSECNIGPGKSNILHLSVRPADFVDDEFDSNKKIPGSPRRGGGNGCCNCIIS